MRIRRLLQILTAGVAVTLFPSAQQIAAQNLPAAALTGVVTSDAEGAMEGVVISAKKAGSTVTVSVMSDAQGHYRFPANRLFDTRTEKFAEYPLPPHTWPYRAAIDKNGEIWTGGMHSDRAVRVNPKTGETVEYQLPKETNMRTVFVDNSTTPVTLWTGSNHGAALVKVEPLD